MYLLVKSSATSFFIPASIAFFFVSLAICFAVLPNMYSPDSSTAPFTKGLTPYCANLTPVLYGSPNAKPPNAPTPELILAVNDSGIKDSTCSSYPNLRAANSGNPNPNSSANAHKVLPTTSYAKLLSSWGLGSVSNFCRSICSNSAKKSSKNGLAINFL